MKVKRIVLQSTNKFFKNSMEKMKKVFEGVNTEPEEIISFPSIENLNKTLSKERFRLINTVKSQKPQSIRELARMLKRDYKNVYQDVIFLEKIGLLKKEKREKNTYLIVDYDKIEIEITIEDFNKIDKQIA